VTFAPENDLESALMRAAKEPAARPEFYRLLLSSDLSCGHWQWMG